MAALIIRSCFKQQPSTRIWSNIMRVERIGNQKKNTYTRIYFECHCYHTTPILGKKHKPAEQQKPPLKSRTRLRVINVWKNMTVAELAEASDRSINDVFEAISYIDERPYTKDKIIEDRNVIFGAVHQLGLKYILGANPHAPKKMSKTTCDAVRRPPPDPSITVKRHPVVTVMGHVDHGKTTLLDSLRNTSVVDSEFGGITQHIGAFNVILDSGEKITFLDTPGHAAFKAMRSRGANSTDIVILVVAADDGVMEQTIQSIRMAKEAKVPIIVAINKIDKPTANIEMTMKMLAQNGIIVESLGGEIPSVNISALKKLNLNELMETVAAQAEVMDLKGDPTGFVEGVVLEVTTEIGRGKLATALIQRGTLRKGSVIVSGLAWAKVRAMFNHAGNPVTQAKLSDAVQIIGWRELPLVGDEIIEVEDERAASMVLHHRGINQAKIKAEEDLEVIEKKKEEHNLIYKAELKERRALGIVRRVKTGLRQKQIIDDGIPRLNVVIKADVLGSVEAILDVFDTYGDEARCRLDVVHYGIGPVSENDVEVANAFQAIIYTFQVKTLPTVDKMAEKLNIPIHHFKVIYKLIDDIKLEICKKLPMKRVEQKLGEANVLQYFEITDKKKKVGVAGCRCTDGILKKNARYRIMRNDEVLYDGKLVAMKHLKTDVTSIKKDVECGLRFQDPNIVVELGDTIICYTTYNEQPSVNWDPGF